MKVRNCLLAVATVAAVSACAPRQEVAAPAPIVHHSPVTSPSPVHVVVPAGRTLVFFSGTTPSPLKPDAPQGTPEYWGTTEDQTNSVLTKIKANLESQGLGFGDVVSMTVYLVADRTKATKDAPARMGLPGHDGRLHQVLR